MARVKQRFGAVLALGFVLAVGWQMPLAAAHVLKTDHGVSGILHIKPDDNPVAAVPTQLEILFNATNRSFSLRDYRLQLQVVQDARVVQTAAVEPAYFGAASEGQATVTFPTPAVYDVVIRGQPVSPAAAAFNLDYIVRVTGSASTEAVNRSWLAPVIVLGGVAAASLIMIAVKAIQAGGRYRPRPKTGA